MAAFRTACTSWETAIEMEGNVNDSVQVALQIHKWSCNAFFIASTSYPNYASELSKLHMNHQWHALSGPDFPIQTDELYQTSSNMQCFSPPFRTVLGSWDFSRSACGLVRRLAVLVHRVPGDPRPLKRVEQRDQAQTIQQASEGSLTFEENTVNDTLMPLLWRGERDTDRLEF